MTLLFSRRMSWEVLGKLQLRGCNSCSEVTEGFGNMTRTPFVHCINLDIEGKKHLTPKLNLLGCFHVWVSIQPVHPLKLYSSFNNPSKKTQLIFDNGMTM